MKRTTICLAVLAVFLLALAMPVSAIVTQSQRYELTPANFAGFIYPNELLTKNPPNPICTQYENGSAFNQPLWNRTAFFYSRDNVTQTNLSGGSRGAFVSDDGFFGKMEFNVTTLPYRYPESAIAETAMCLPWGDFVVGKWYIMKQTKVPIQANFTIKKNELRVRFFDSSTGGVDGWMWAFGDGTKSRNQNPIHTYQLAGTYKVTLTAFRTADPQETSVVTKSILVRIRAPDNDPTTGEL
jgi:PKD repeat protein